jgi:hypothetical protein
LKRTDGLIDLKQFEGHTEGPWVIVPCDISSSELKNISGGVHALFPKNNLEDGETKALCILSAFTQFSEEDQATWKLMQKAPELLEEVIVLREKLSIRQHIETIHSLQCCANCESYCFKFKEISFCHFMNCDVDPTTVCGDWSNGKSTK